MDERRKDAMEAISRAIQELGNNMEDGCDDESTREKSKAVYRLARAYAILSATR